MHEVFHGRPARKSGLLPGTLVHVGDEHTEPVKITVFSFDADHYEERELCSVEECFSYRDSPNITWINVDGVHRVDIVEALGSHFGLHSLLLEDVLHTNQRPKMEEFENCVYLVLRMLYSREENGEPSVDDEQISLVLGPNVVITFQEAEGDIFDPIRQRIRENRGRIRKCGADYLAYTLMDVVVDNYFNVLEQFGEQIEEVEADLMRHPSRDTLQEIQRMKRFMIEVRRTVWPLREVINVLLRGETPFFEKTTLMFLRDVYDHAIRVIDITETYREMVGGMLDIYLSQVSNRMNEVMKVLTVIATIFIPLTFIAGVYGMNFEHMPELHWALGYPVVWVLMVVVAASLLGFFRRKNWL